MGWRDTAPYCNATTIATTIVQMDLCYNFSPSHPMAAVFHGAAWRVQLMVAKHGIAVPCCHYQLHPPEQHQAAANVAVLCLHLPYSVRSQFPCNEESKTKCK
jgi:hypothetical protein